MATGKAKVIDNAIMGFIQQRQPWCEQLMSAAISGKSPTGACALFGRAGCRSPMWLRAPLPRGAAGMGAGFGVGFGRGPC